MFAVQIVVAEAKLIEIKKELLSQLGSEPVPIGGC